MENSLKTNQAILKSLKQVGLTAQVHGVQRIFNNERVILKIFWIICLITSVSTFLCFFYTSLLSYLEYPFITKTSIKHQKSMLFPSIVICPLKQNTNTYNLSDVIIECLFDFKKKCSQEPYFHQAKNTGIKSKTCYEFNKSRNQTNWLETSRSGQLNGLVVKIFEGLYEENRTDLLNSIHSNGLEVYILNQSEPIHFPSNIVIHPGEATFISLSKVIENKLTEPYNNCIDDVKIYKAYHLFNSSLFDEINSRYTYSQMQCLNFAFLKSLKCSKSFKNLFDCVSELSNLNASRLFNEHNIFIEKNYEKLTDQFCPRECVTIEYQTLITHSYYPSYDEYLNLLQNTKLISKFPKGNQTSVDELRKSVYELYVFFDDLKYIEITQHPKFGLWDLISNIGGLLGFFLGISALSFVDFFQIIFEIIFIMIDLKKNTVHSFN